MGRRRIPDRVAHEVLLGRAVIESDPDYPEGRLLLVGGAQQSYVDLADPTHLEFEYVRWVAHLLDTRPPGPLRVLHLGGGGLTLPRYVRATRPGSGNVVVELDAALVELVRAHLPWGPGIRVRVGDARAALEATPAASADVVISDVFAGARTPGSLTSVEFLAHAARVLVPGGVFVANIADDSPFGYSRRYLAGVLAVFAEVAALADPAVWRGRRFGNLVIAAGATGSFDPDELAARTRSDAWPARVVSRAGLLEFCRDAVPYGDANAAGSPEPPFGVFGAENANF